MQVCPGVGPSCGAWTLVKLIAASTSPYCVILKLLIEILLMLEVASPVANAFSVTVDWYPAL